jgi:hypothetical protein
MPAATEPGVAMARSKRLIVLGIVLAVVAALVRRRRESDSAHD